MKDNPDRLRSEQYRARFDEYFARADECQRLADRHPAVRRDYEGLAHAWRELAKQGEQT